MTKDCNCGPRKPFDMKEMHQEEPVKVDKCPTCGKVLLRCKCADNDLEK